MKKGFPKKILGFPIGWQDRGNVENHNSTKEYSYFITCSMCSTRARIGIEKAIRFKFCPRCLIKLITKK